MTNGTEQRTKRHSSEAEDTHPSSFVVGKLPHQRE